MEPKIVHGDIRGVRSAFLFVNSSLFQPGQYTCERNAATYARGLWPRRDVRRLSGGI
jgi:hypothetical protein